MTRVLIVDDFLEDRFFLSQTLSEIVDGLECREFAYAEDALAHLCADDTPQYDLIFVDINMLRMAGFAFVDAIVEHNPDQAAAARIYLVSGTFDREDIQCAEDHPAIDALLKKPVMAKTLGEILPDRVTF